MELDRVPLWRDGPDGEKASVTVRQLWEDFTRYPYLSRLLRRSVLEDAVKDGVANTARSADSFAYADAHNGERYVGLRAGQQITSVDPGGLVVHPDAAAAQLATDAAAALGPDTGETAAPVGSAPSATAAPVGYATAAGKSGTVLGEDGTASGRVGTTLGRAGTVSRRVGTTVGPTGLGEPGEPLPPTRYYGRVTLPSDRWTRIAAEIAEGVVQPLIQNPGARVAITIEVEATADEGFNKTTQADIAENTITLKFDATDFDT